MFALARALLPRTMVLPRPSGALFDREMTFHSCP